MGLGNPRRVVDGALFFGRPLPAYWQLAARARRADGDGAAGRRRMLSSSFAQFTPTLRCGAAGCCGGGGARTRRGAAERGWHALRARGPRPAHPAAGGGRPRATRCAPLTVLPCGPPDACLCGDGDGQAQHARRLQADECAKEPPYLGTSREARLQSRHCGAWPSLRYAWHAPCGERPRGPCVPAVRAPPRSQPARHLPVPLIRWCGIWCAAVSFSCARTCSTCRKRSRTSRPCSSLRSFCKKRSRPCSPNASRTCR